MTVSDVFKEGFVSFNGVCICMCLSLFYINLFKSYLFLCTVSVYLIGWF